MGARTTANRTQPHAQHAPDAALAEIERSERTFSGFDQARLWFVFGVGLLVIQSGTFLTPMVGTRDAWIAVLLGSIVGSGILAWAARLGCITGLASAGLMVSVFGTRFGRLPITLNILQLIGWTTFELVVLRSVVLALAAPTSSLPVQAASAGSIITIGCGLALMLLLSVPMVTLVHRVVGRVDLPMELLALAWVTWQLAAHGVAHPVVPSPPVPPHQGFGAALDLVIAMPFPGCRWSRITLATRVRDPTRRAVLFTPPGPATPRPTSGATASAS